MAPAPRPFHGPADPGPEPRLLLISYNFPPSPAVGGLRWQKLARLAAERGVALDVITLDPAQVDRPDAGRLRDLPATTRVFGVPHRETLVERAERMALGAVRAIRPAHRPAPAASATTSAATPGPSAAPAGSMHRTEVSWRPFSARVLKRVYTYLIYDATTARAWGEAAGALADALARRHAYRALISCGPPHRQHPPARRVARRHGLPLVLDLRDPWSLQERMSEPIATPLYFSTHRRLERQAFADAALIVCNTEPARAELAALHPRHAARIVTVMNGVDEEPLPAPARRERFVINYAGSIYLDRDPSTFLRAVGAAVRSLGVGPDRFGLHFVGDAEEYEGRSLRSLSLECGIADYLRLEDKKPRSSVLQDMADASMLLVLPQDSEMAIPAKVFEYMQFPAWILALVQRESATGRLLAGRDADVTPPGDEAAIADAIVRRFRQWAAGEPPPRLADDPAVHRRAQGERLFAALASAGVRLAADVKD